MRLLAESKAVVIAITSYSLLKPDYASTSDKKISLFARAVRKIVDFFRWCVTFEPLCTFRHLTGILVILLNFLVDAFLKSWFEQTEYIECQNKHFKLLVTKLILEYYGKVIWIEYFILGEKHRHLIYRRKENVLLSLV